VERTDFEWDVRRAGRTVFIDVTRAETVTEADADAIVAATEELLAHDEVQFVQLDGPVVGERAPGEGLDVAIERLQQLALRHDKPMVVAPI